MSEVALIWMQFALCIVLIGFAGVKLTRYGDVIAEKTGMGGAWIGLILMAMVTSLPELVTGVSAVTLAGTPDIAVGDALGSCVFNLGIIFILDFLHRGESVYTRAHQGHILSAGFGVILLGMAGANILIGERLGHLAIGHVGIYTPVIMLLYLIAMRTVFFYERDKIRAAVEENVARYPDISLKFAVQRYAAAALVVVAAGLWLPFVGKGLAVQMGWHESFVGTLLIAFVTSVPEMVVTVSALRIGALDMAIGNLFGSNLFDVLILAVDDVFYLDGPILSHVSPPM